MRTIVDDSCIGCGVCEQMCPEVFQLGDDGMARVLVDEVGDDVRDCCREAAESCPVDAIQIDE